jgi:hypothetical protein
MSPDNKDLAVIFLTVNRVPDKWAEYHKSVLLEAIGNAELITISKKPLNWGRNLIQDEEPSVSNIYRQLLRGAKLTNRPYIAVAEDDTLYHKDHFLFRPSLDTFAFDGHRWGLLTWGKPFYYYKDRISNACMIAPRELMIESLEERFTKYPENRIGELGKEKGTSIDRRKTVQYWPDTGIVFFSHRNSLDPTEQHKSKKPGVVQAYSIPHWGEAVELVKKFI